MKKTVEQYLEDIDLSRDASYVPSDFALHFINFIKLVNGGKGEENVSPVIHYKMLDALADKEEDSLANLCSRGMAKSAIFAEYLILYIAVFGGIPGIPALYHALYVSDSIENGVKKMGGRIRNRHKNSTFLQKYLKNVTITVGRWYFENVEGKELVVGAYGAQTGVRGTVELNTRPQLAILDDLVSDSDANSAIAIKTIEDTVYSAIENAMHPKQRKIIWSGTPFNARDPLYKAIESGAWKVNIFPICEKFPCSREEFRGSWEDRFDYDFVLKVYTKLKLAGKVASFNQELMLRIMSDEERLVQPSDVNRFKMSTLAPYLENFNIYITTDFATSERSSADFSVITVTGINHVGNKFWLDGVCKKQDMGKNVKDLFRLCQKYNPMGVGIEVSGQQGGFIPWIEEEMIRRNCFFHLVSENNSNKKGIRPSTDKLSRFNIILPWFKQGDMYYPNDMETHEWMVEFEEELFLISKGGMKSKHDDVIDTLSMLSVMQMFKPSIEYVGDDGDGDDDTYYMGNYV